jgi:cobalt-zinc-cadmium efflux system protein
VTTRRHHAAEQRALVSALGLTGLLCGVELVGGWWTNSLALVSDAVHMLTDMGALALALFALWIAGREASDSKTFGWYRAEILAALVNGVVLLAVAAGILIEAYRRLIEPPEIKSAAMLAIAGVGLLVNLASVWLLHQGARESLNVSAAYLEVLSDAVTSVGVIVAALLVLLTGAPVIDPLVSAAIAVFIVPRTWRLLRQAVNVLLEGVPPHLDMAEIQAAIEREPGVRRVHDLHVWTLTSGREAMSAHVVVDDYGSGERILECLHALLHTRFGIDHTTIQLETERPAVLTIKARS